MERSGVKAITDCLIHGYFSGFSCLRPAAAQWIWIFQESLPGMGHGTLLTVISECGTDMRRWPTAKHFTSWLGLAPRNKVSGGRLLSSGTAVGSQSCPDYYLDGRASFGAYADISRWISKTFSSEDWSPKGNHCNSTQVGRTLLPSITRWHIPC
ncbi:IS110 family transposase [Synechococcus sp. CBW1006]|nr:IS110 family transposase [Synechococcus sp. CBW1006]